MTHPLIFDTHAHYDDERFQEDRDSVLRTLPERGVCGIVNCGAGWTSSEESLRLAAAYSYVYAAVGVHPEEAVGYFTQEDRDRLRELAGHPKVVAIGEIGLDYHYEHVKSIQIEWFTEQVQLAKELDLPIIVHDREAHGDVMEILRTQRPRGIIHCFSGSADLAMETVRLGMYVGLGGAVTFKNARRALEVAACVPADRLVLETDCPYMAPVPHRGHRCDSSMIALTAQTIARIRGISVEELLSTTKANACRIYGIREEDLA